MKNSQKGFAPIFLIIAVLVISGGGYYAFHKNKIQKNKEITLTATTTPTKSVSNDNQITTSRQLATTTDKNIATVDPYPWPVYRNNLVNYQIKYPREIEVIDYNPNKVEFVIDRYINSSVTQFITSNPHVYVHRDVDYYSPALTLQIIIENIKNTENLSLKDWVDKNELSGRQAPTPSSKEEIMINGIPAYKVEYEKDNSGFRQGGFTPVFYYMFYDNKLYRIRGIKVPEDITTVVKEKNDGLIPDVKKYQAVFDAMLTTFTFVAASTQM